MMVLCAISSDDRAAQIEAREWIKRHGLTADDVKIVKRDAMILVLDRGPAFEKLKGPE